MHHDFAKFSPCFSYSPNDYGTFVQTKTLISCITLTLTFNVFVKHTTFRSASISVFYYALCCKHLKNFHVDFVNFWNMFLDNCRFVEFSSVAFKWH